jgi:hypothetical protein
MKKMMLWMKRRRWNRRRKQEGPFSLPTLSLHLLRRHCRWSSKRTQRQRRRRLREERGGDRRCGTARARRSTPAPPAPCTAPPRRPGWRRCPQCPGRGLENTPTTEQHSTIEFSISQRTHIQQKRTTRIKQGQIKGKTTSVYEVTFPRVNHMARTKKYQQCNTTTKLGTKIPVRTLALESRSTARVVERSFSDDRLLLTRLLPRWSELLGPVLLLLLLLPSADTVEEVLPSRLATSRNTPPLSSSSCNSFLFKRMPVGTVRKRT